MTKVLITGIAGLLGSHFSRYLLAKGYDVVGIDDFSGGFRENLALINSSKSKNLTMYIILQLMQQKDYLHL